MQDGGGALERLRRGGIEASEAARAEGVLRPLTLPATETNPVVEEVAKLAKRERERLVNQIGCHGGVAPLVARAEHGVPALEDLAGTGDVRRQRFVIEQELQDGHSGFELVHFSASRVAEPPLSGVLICVRRPSLNPDSRALA